jgi:GxxExxY protein
MKEPSGDLDHLAHEEALSIEMNMRKMPFTRQVVVGVNYKNSIVGKGKLDFLIGGQLIVELKAVEMLGPIHSAQLLSYLKTTGCLLGLLINFNTPILKGGIKRIILS